LAAHASAFCCRQALGEHFDFPMLRDHASKTLHLPIKLLFPAGLRGGFQTYHMLGLGDMAIPGIFLALALSFDKHLANERARKDGGGGGSSCGGGGHESFVVSGAGGDGPGVSGGGEAGGARERHAAEASNSALATAAAAVAVVAAALPLAADRAYFYAARRGYVGGIALSIGASRATGAAQPALLYLVPCVLAPLVARAKTRNHLGLLWAGFPEEEEEEEEEEDGGDNGNKGAGGIDERDEEAHVSDVFSGSERNIKERNL
jgi:hypothetical protein